MQSTNGFERGTAALLLAELLNEQQDFPAAAHAYEAALATGHHEIAPAAAFGLGRLRRDAGDLDGAILTSGGPADWLGPGQGFTVVQVAANSRDGLPVRAVLQALNGAPLYRTDRLGTVELVAAASHFLTPGLELD